MYFSGESAFSPGKTASNDNKLSIVTGKKKPKAVCQLINFIEKLLKNEFDLDSSYYYRDVFIYPILITHDHQYDVPGFDELINYWFQEEFQHLKDKGLFVRRVKPLAVVNIDTLIYHQIAFSSKIPLHKALDLYFDHKAAMPNKQYIKTEDQLRAFMMNKYLPFGTFIGKYFNQRNIGKMPPILELVEPALFGPSKK